MPLRTHFAPDWNWFGSPAGRYLRECEQLFLERRWPELTGDRLLWVGLDAPAVPAGYRVAGALLAALGPGDHPASGQCYVEPGQLPVRDGEFDVVILQHGIDCAVDPYAALREATRVVRSGGWLVIYGLNPWSALGMTRRWGTMPGLSAAAHWISPVRMADWLSLLGFQVVRSGYLMYRPIQGRWWRHLEPVRGRVRSMLPLGTAYALATRRQGSGPSGLRLAGRTVSQTPATAARAVPGALIVADEGDHER